MRFEIKNRFTGEVQYTCELSAEFAGKEYSIQLGAAVRSAVSSDANLARANLADANLASANLARANLARANLADANLADANLARANLADANLASANLADANLASANLADANLADANLAGAYLADANLADANLADANLAGAYLAGANLASAKWTHAITLTCQPLQIYGLPYTVTLINGTHAQIGCHLKSCEEWMALEESAVREIEDDAAVEFWRKYRTVLFDLSAAHFGVAVESNRGADAREGESVRE